MKGKLLLVLCLVLLLSCFSYSRISQTETKASSGSPVHNLNTGLDYTTIQDAINANDTLDGQKILVDDGTYYENVFVNKSLTLIGENMEKTIVDGNASGSPFTLNAENVSLINFTAANAGLAVPTAQANCAILVNQTTNCLVENMITLDSSLVGIALVASNHNKISGCECLGNPSPLFEEDKQPIGVVLLDSNENMISNNVISTNWVGFAHWGSGCNNNVLTENQVSFSLDNGFDIIGMNNTITCNQIWNNTNGVIFDHGSRNIVKGNNISNSTMSGVYISLGDANNTIAENTIHTNQYGIFVDWNSGINNLFYHNNFVNNKVQALSTNSSLNIWDDGYPSGGNFWNDYNGTDANHDGIGDTPYVIDANNTDNYPLMVQYAIPEFSSFLVLPLFFMATPLAVIVYKKKGVKQAKLDRT